MEIPGAWTMRSRLQTHKDRQIFFCDYVDLEIDQLQAELNAVDAFIMQQPQGSVLVLADVRGVSPTRENLSMFIKSVQHTKKYLRKSAAIGVGFSGQRKVLFDAVMRISGGNMVVFEDIEQAKDWLVRD